MQDFAEVKISSLVLKNATTAQLDALQNNIMAPGKWENADGVDIWLEYGTVMVSPWKMGPSREVGKLTEKQTLIVIGIETDGYTHS